MKQYMLDADALGYTLFRNNVGAAWQGKKINQTPGTITLKGYRFIRYGVGGKGGSDLIGFKRVTVTPDMVGQTIPVFAAVEVKRKRGRIEVRDEQKQFRDGVLSHGGIAVISRTAEDLP
jgi:hypothetical protein